MTSMRVLIAACLTLVLIATSGAMAVARGQMAAAGPAFSMVICTGNGTETLRLDADGNPVQASHACPECVIAGATPLPTQGLALEISQSVTSAFMVRVLSAPATSVPCAGGYPRAPPTLV